MQRIGRSERLLDIGSMDAEMAERLYRQLKDEVGTETKSFIGESLGMRINGAVFEDFPFILSAMEGRTAKLVKILRVVDGAGPLEDRELDVSYEIASADFTHSSIVPMVHRIVSIDQETAVRAHCKVGENNVLVMPWYHGSLNKHPSRCLNWIADEGTKLLDALRYLHDEKNFVHMDVKAMNVFVDKDGHWLLGDFGSCKPVGEIITSCTSLFYFEDPNGSVAHPKYDYFMFLVMLLIEALPDRRTFHREFYDNTDSRHCSKQKVLTMAKSLASAGDSKAFETLLGQVLGNLSQCDVK